MQRKPRRRAASQAWHETNWHVARNPCTCRAVLPLSLPLHACPHCAALPLHSGLFMPTWQIVFHGQSPPRAQSSHFFLASGRTTFPRGRSSPPEPTQVIVSPKSHRSFAHATASAHDSMHSQSVWMLVSSVSCRSSRPSDILPSQAISERAGRPSSSPSGSGRAFPRTGSSSPRWATKISPLKELL